MKTPHRLLRRPWYTPCVAFQRSPGARPNILWADLPPRAPGNWRGTPTGRGPMALVHGVGSWRKNPWKNLKGNRWISLRHGWTTRWPSHGPKVLCDWLCFSQKLDRNPGHPPRSSPVASTAFLGTNGCRFQRLHRGMADWERGAINLFDSLI